MKILNDVVVDRLCQYLEEKNITQYRLAILSGIPFAVSRIKIKRTKEMPAKLRAFRKYAMIFSLILHRSLQTLLSNS